MIASTPIVLSGPLRKPAQMLAEQSYGGHKSVHDGDAAAKLGLAGAPIEGPTHFSQFDPLAAAMWGDRWFTHGCISAHFQTMVVEGEEVRAELSLNGPGATQASINAHRADGTPVLTGTASVGPDHGETALSARLAAAIARPPEKLYVLDLLKVGQRGPADETICAGFDDFLGELYPFTLRQKLATITETISYYREGGSSPWGGAIFPFEMMSVLTNVNSKHMGFMARQPSVGLFIDLEVKMLGGPVMVGKTYGLRREILALGASKRTESYWSRTTLMDGSKPVAEVLLHQGVFKASYPGYPGEA